MDETPDPEDVVATALAATDQMVAVYDMVFLPYLEALHRKMRGRGFSRRLTDGLILQVHTVITNAAGGDEEDS